MESVTESRVSIEHYFTDDEWDSITIEEKRKYEEEMENYLENSELDTPKPDFVKRFEERIQATENEGFGEAYPSTSEVIEQKIFEITKSRGSVFESSSEDSESFSAQHLAFLQSSPAVSITSSAPESSILESTTTEGDYAESSFKETSVTLSPTSCSGSNMEIATECSGLSPANSSSEFEGWQSETSTLFDVVSESRDTTIMMPDRLSDVANNPQSQGTVQQEMESQDSAADSFLSNNAHTSQQSSSDSNVSTSRIPRPVWRRKKPLLNFKGFARVGAIMSEYEETKRKQLKKQIRDSEDEILCTCMCLCCVRMRENVDAVLLPHTAPKSRTKTPTSSKNLIQHNNILPACDELKFINNQNVRDEISNKHEASLLPPDASKSAAEQPNSTKHSSENFDILPAPDFLNPINEPVNNVICSTEHNNFVSPLDSVQLNTLPLDIDIPVIDTTPVDVIPINMISLNVPPLHVTTLKVPPLNVPPLHVKPLNVPPLNVPPLQMSQLKVPPLHVPPLNPLPVNMPKPTAKPGSRAGKKSTGVQPPGAPKCTKKPRRKLSIKYGTVFLTEEDKSETSKFSRVLKALNAAKPIILPQRENSNNNSTVLQPNTQKQSTTNKQECFTIKYGTVYIPKEQRNNLFKRVKVTKPVDLSKSVKKQQENDLNKNSPFLKPVNEPKLKAPKCKGKYSKRNIGLLPSLDPQKLGSNGSKKYSTTSVPLDTPKPVTKKQKFESNSNNPGIVTTSNDAESIVKQPTTEKKAEDHIFLRPFDLPQSTPKKYRNIKNYGKRHTKTQPSVSSTVGPLMDNKTSRPLDATKSGTTQYLGTTDMGKGDTNFQPYRIPKLQLKRNKDGGDTWQTF